MSLQLASSTFLGTLFVVLCITSVANAEPITDAAEDIAVRQDQVVRTLIRQLDANQFSQRQNASDELAKLGKVAVPAMEQAAQNGSGEVASRTIDLLKSFAGSPDDETASMALSALRRLASGGNKSAGFMAQEAIEQLKRKLGPHRIDQDQARPAMLPQVGFQRSVRISNNNGSREIDVTENGERIVVRTAVDGSVSITWHLPNGKEKTVEADSAADLKKQDQASFAKLQQLIKIADNGPARMPALENMPRIRVRAPRMGNELDPFTGGDAAQPKPDVTDFEDIKRRMDEMRKSVEAKGADEFDSLKLKRLDEALRQIEETVKDAEPTAS